MQYIYHLGILLILSNAFASHAPQIIVATGEKNTTYSIMFNELGDLCSKTAQWMERKTPGSTANFKLLLNNKVDLSFMQRDLIELKHLSKKEYQQITEQLLPQHKINKSNIRVFLPLHSEEIHLISKANNLDPFEKRKKIATWGGSTVTALIIKKKLRLNYQIITFYDKESALKSLNQGNVDLILAVVGQPVQWIKNLKDHKLIPLYHSRNLDGIYEEAWLSNYKGSSISTDNIPTVSVKSAIFVKNNIDDTLKEVLKKYRKCAQKKLKKLKSFDFHIKWKDVEIY